MKLDDDVKQMSFGERAAELQRLRNLIRTHKSKKGNARCWKTDADLYTHALPEGDSGMGRMDLPRKILLKQCERYIDCQQRHPDVQRQINNNTQMLLNLVPDRPSSWEPVD